MKLEELTDTCIQEPKSSLVIELPNGQHLPTKSYKHSTNTKGEPIVIVLVGKIK